MEPRATSADFADDFARLLGHPEVDAFSRRAAAIETGRFAKSWLGVNLRGAQLLSLKVYFTFYEPLAPEVVAELFGSREIAEDFERSAAAAGPEVLRDPALAGSGHTFCAKVDRRQAVTLGFHHRLADPLRGVFRLYGAGGCTQKDYLYFSDPRLRRRLARRFALPILLECDTVEVGKGVGHGLEPGAVDLKFILIGEFGSLRRRLFDPLEERAIRSLESGWDLRVPCGGFFWSRPEKSAYLVSPTSSGRRLTTVERVLARRAEPRDRAQDVRRRGPRSVGAGR